MPDEPTCTRPVRRACHGPGRTVCGFRVLGEPNADGERYCWHHADTAAKAAHKLALARAQRLAKVGSELLAFVRDLAAMDPLAKPHWETGRIVGNAKALLKRVEGAETA